MDLISRERLIDEVVKIAKTSESDWRGVKFSAREIKFLIELQKPIESRPSGVMIHCKDCKYYREDLWGDVYGMPVIVAHQVCIKWGNGCKTIEDGYCHLGELRGEE